MDRSTFSAKTGRLLAAAGLLVAALQTPAAFADSSPATGTLVGTVTCGPAEDVMAAHAIVSVPDAGAAATTDGNGSYTISGVPAGQSLAVTAAADPQGTAAATRPNVSVPAGQTLNIGNLDLSVCPTPPPILTPPDYSALLYWQQFTPKGSF